MLAQGFIGIGANLERLQRRISAVERSTARAELIELRARRESVADKQRESQPADSESALPHSEGRAEASPGPHPTAQSRTPDLESTIGFVPSIPAEAAA